MTTMPEIWEGVNSHHFLTAPAAICAYCEREYPRDASAPTNLFCAGCRQSHHADAEADGRRLREKIASLEKTHATEVEILKTRIIKLERFIDKVMDKLYQIDPVAYVRYASVYRQFEDVNEFIQEIQSLSRRAARDPLQRRLFKD